jgi:hypothetical protein
MMGEGEREYVGVIDGDREREYAVRWGQGALGTEKEKVQRFKGSNKVQGFNRGGAAGSKIQCEHSVSNVIQS